MAIDDPARSLAQEAIWSRALLLQSLREVCHRRGLVTPRCSKRARLNGVVTFMQRVLNCRLHRLGAAFLTNDSLRLSMQLVRLRLLCLDAVESNALASHIERLNQLARVIAEEAPRLYRSASGLYVRVH